MNTIEDFKNAPIGATATDADGNRAMKTYEDEWSWVKLNGMYLGDKEMVYWDYTLDTPAPTSAREALDLAWDFAHPVKEGQVIPTGTRYLESYGSALREYTAPFDIEIGFNTVPEFRTLDPLPDPEPEWLNAPAVIATCGYCETKALHGRLEHDTRWERAERGPRWVCADCQTVTSSPALTDVTPLYPLAEGTLNGTEASEGYAPSNSMGLKNEETEK